MDKENVGELMPVYKKPSESTLVNHCMRVLGAYENVGKVTWFTRLQSGHVRVVKGWKGKRHEHYMHLCRKGTPDIMAVLANGVTLWLELKTKTGKVRPEQDEFRQRIGALDGHVCLVIKNVGDIEQAITLVEQGLR